MQGVFHPLPRFVKRLVRLGSFGFRKVFPIILEILFQNVEAILLTQSMKLNPGYWLGWL